MRVKGIISWFNGCNSHTEETPRFQPLTYFAFFLLVDQITVIENKMNVKRQCLQIFDLKLNKYARFSLTWLWVAVG